MELVARFFSLVPLILYTVVAIMLTIIAIFSLYDSVIGILQLLGFITTPQGTTVDIVTVINALLLTITIIVLFETVSVYFRTKHVEVRALLVAGLTGTVRHVLVYNVAKVDANVMFAVVALLAVLIVGIIYVKPEPTP
jgi:uncharacterized membrane protein (DUF373 family)